MRLIDADALLRHEIESDRIKGVMLVVGKGHILSAPTIDPVTRGAWLSEHDDARCYYEHTCSVCKAKISGSKLVHWAYCPNCGARMDKSPI